MALSEDDLMTLGTGKVNARLLVTDLIMLKQGLTLEVESSDQSLSAAATVLLRRLNDEDHEVRAASLERLGRHCKVTDRRALSPVIERLGDPHASVRRAASAALSTLADKGDKKVIDSVAKALRDVDAAVRLAALETIQSLIEMGDRNLPLSNAITGVLEDRCACRVYCVCVCVWDLCARLTCVWDRCACLTCVCVCVCLLAHCITWWREQHQQDTQHTQLVTQHTNSRHTQNMHS